MISDKSAMRKLFCKDLCDELLIPGEPAPVYPKWAMYLAHHMIVLGWKKGERAKGERARLAT